VGACAADLSQFSQELKLRSSQQDYAHGVLKLHLTNIVWLKLGVASLAGQVGPHSHDLRGPGIQPLQLLMLHMGCCKLWAEAGCQLLGLGCEGLLLRGACKALCVRGDR
jgi:hypothetical protein